MRQCIKCGNTLVKRQTKFCSIKCKNGHHQSYGSQRQRAESRKKEYVIRAGGACLKCGYDKNLMALTFHHVDPSQKSFPLEARSFANRTIEKVDQEFKKCILLCANCHIEHHNPSGFNWK